MFHYLHLNLRLIILHDYFAILNFMQWRYHGSLSSHPRNFKDHDIQSYNLVNGLYVCNGTCSSVVFLFFLSVFLVKSCYSKRYELFEERQRRLRKISCMNYVIIRFLNMFLKNITINTGFQKLNQGHSYWVW